MSLSPIIEECFSSAVIVEDFFRPNQISNFRKNFERREQPPVGMPSESCKTNLFFGFFFDGTKNNYEQAQATNNHSNIARLYDCYPGLSVPGVLPASTDWAHNLPRYGHFFRVYIPGVASPFLQVGDSGAGVQAISGAAAGAFGDFRIVWALIQAVNNVHRFFMSTPLISAAEAKELSRTLILNKSTRALLDGRGTDSSMNKREKQVPRKFEEVLLRLHEAMSRHWPNEKTGRPAKIDPGIVKTIYISVFGFSRGATEARVFVNWLQSLCRLDARLRGKTGGMSLGGFPVHFDFLGLFDNGCLCRIGKSVWLL